MNFVVSFVVFVAAFALLLMLFLLLLLFGGKLTKCDWKVGEMKVAV